MKLGLLFKETSEKFIKNALEESNGFFIVNYSGLSSPHLTTLRQSLRDSKARLFVVKNSVARRALKNVGGEDIIKTIEGPCCLVFVKDEPIDTSHILYNFSREHQQLKLEGGFLEDKILTKKDIERLANLPKKEVLRAQVVLTLKSPVFGLVLVLNQVLRSFVWCLEQIKNKKGESHG